MLREFRAFILRGNLVDLAVAVVIGTAFTAVVNAMVKDLVTPLIAAVGGNANFGNLAFTINGSRFAYGDFLNALLTFLLVAAVVNALVKDLVTPLIAAIGGEPDFDRLAFTINGSRFAYGDFLNALIAFLLVAAVIFFLVVKPVNALMSRYRPEPAPDRETRACPECLSDIPVAARRCAFCTAEQPA